MKLPKFGWFRHFAENFRLNWVFVSNWGEVDRILDQATTRAQTWACMYGYDSREQSLRESQIFQLLFAETFEQQLPFQLVTRLREVPFTLSTWSSPLASHTNQELRKP